MTGIIAAEGGYQEFALKGGERAVLWLSAAAALLALAVGFYLVRSVMAYDEGTPKMREIAGAIQEGAWAYLKRQFRTIGLILVPLVVIVFITSTAIKKGDGSEALTFAQSGIFRTVAFVLGCVASGLTGYIGMTLATRGNVRTAAAALTNSMPKALTVAFRTGGVAGMFTVGLGLIGATGIIMIFQNTSSVILVGFGFGGSLLALFLRVGGGIFTKAADVGADLVGKVEAGIPEDDPRNPAVIADNVGDNVGDCAGMAADLFETYAVTIVATMLLAAIFFTGPAVGQMMMFPLLIGGVCIAASVAGTFFVKLGPDGNIMKALYKGLVVTGIASAVLIGIITHLYVGFSTPYTISGLAFTGRHLFYCALIGLAVTGLLVWITEYYTGTHFRPVQSIAESSTTEIGRAHV